MGTVTKVYKMLFDLTIHLQEKLDKELMHLRQYCICSQYSSCNVKISIQLLCLTDARTVYLLNAYIYTGKYSDELNLLTEYSRLKKITQE